MTGTRILRQSALYLRNHSSTILTCVGAVGLVATAVLAVKATPKAMERLNEAEVEKHEDLTKTEKFLVAAPEYIPAVLTGATTIACIFGANVLNKRQQAALASAYMLLERTYKSYKDKAVELYGDDADKNIRHAVVKEKCKEIERQPHGDETLLFYEEHYGEFFERTMLQVQDAEYQLNRKFAMDGEASLNDFFELLGLNEMKIGDALGWSQECICDFYNPAWIDFEHELVTMEDGMECYIINILVSPMIDYNQNC